MDLHGAWNFGLRVPNGTKAGFGLAQAFGDPLVSEI